MNNDLKWLENIPKLSNEQIVLYIQGISFALERVENEKSRNTLIEKWGCLNVEAIKRGLNINE